MKAIALGWREEALALNAQEVAELGRQLYDRIGTLAGHWNEVGSKLEKAVVAYHASVGTLETRVLVTARKWLRPRARRSRRRRRSTRCRGRCKPELVAREAVQALDRIARIG